LVFIFRDLISGGDVNIEGFEKRFVAFIDILGFKKLIDSVEAATEESADFQRAKDILDFLHRESVESNGHHDLLVYKQTKDGLLETELGDPRLSYISDCVIISTEGSFDGFKAICNKITKLSVQGASIGIYIRGAVTYGNVYHHGPMLFGTAYQRAYELEPKALYPRVIMDEVVFDFLKGDSGTFPLNEAAIRIDSDGRKYLLNYPFNYLSGYVTDWLGFLLRVKSSILYFLNKFDGRVSGFGPELKRLDKFCCWKELYGWNLNFDGDDSRVLDKYIWLKDEFNATILKYSWYLEAREGAKKWKEGVQEGPRILPIIWNGTHWGPEKELGHFR
jgi:hypothetical protein